jgi:2-polyprenyl-6-methoxyphenol hydroxylase-like FAD-dependent oxidoreductase
MPKSPQVLVVGAGPTGLLLAAELERRRVGCLVIDANAAPLEWDRATVVHPRSLEVFESLGLVDRLLDEGVKQRVIKVYSEGGSLGEIDLADCGSRYGFNIGISEQVVEAHLTAYLQRQGGSILRSSRLTKLEEVEDGLVATFDHEGESQSVRVAWVVGCDGLHSTTRTLCGIEHVGHDIAEPWAVFDVTLAGWPDTYEANYVYLDEAPVILTALPNRRWRAYVRPRTQECDLVAETAEILSRYYPQVTFEDVEHPTRFHCHAKVASRYRAGRVLLAGDAAHVCTPAEGHGMNCGMQDAFNLAWKLARVCRGESDAALLDSYEAERRPVAVAIAASGDAVEELQKMADATARRSRNETLRAMIADAASRHHEAVAEAELDIDYSGSPIVMGTKNDTLAPGARLPNTIEVRLASGELCGLHEVGHCAGHTALVIGGPSADAARLLELKDAFESRRGELMLDVVFVCTTQGDEHATLSVEHAALLGGEEITLLILRPDGHVGLRAEEKHLAAVEEYCERLGP